MHSRHSLETGIRRAAAPLSRSARHDGDHQRIHKQNAAELMTSIDAEIARIRRLDKKALRAAWRQLRNTDPPGSLSVAMMRAALIYHCQAKQSGGLSTSTRRKLDRIAIRIAEKPDAALVDVSSPTPGTRLIREWRGRRHHVEVLENGFAWQGKVYKSLSEIARKITGTHWSGPRFFGLRNRRNK